MTNDKLEQLQQIFQKLKKVVIAFSGGVDSTFLAAVAKKVLDKDAIAITIKSPLLPEHELSEAKQIAKSIGISHFIIAKEANKDSWFKNNPSDRCYICKKSNLQLIKDYCEKNAIEGQLIEGSNFDDLDDYRPGHKAVKELKVRSPLIEAKLTKNEIRDYAKKLNLNCWDKPASPCLATRFPFGEEITQDKLTRVYKAEKYLKEIGLQDVRVRVHNNIARIETLKQQFDLVFKNSENISKMLIELGFDFITVDLEGYKKGSMNISKK